MATINYAAREISVKIVYYGPGLSGKTTNLQIIHRKIPTEAKSDMISLATETDRTLFFDFLPLDLGKIRGFTTKFQLYTVPGQVYYNATRKLVLRGVDGIVFVADSAADKLKENIESYGNMEENLAEYGYKRETIPIILQYNKRDLANAMPIEYIDNKLNKYHLHWNEAIANRGKGVFESLKNIGKLVIDQLNRKYASSSKKRYPGIQKPVQKAFPPAPPSQPPISKPVQSVQIGKQPFKAKQPIQKPHSQLIPDQQSIQRTPPPPLPPKHMQYGLTNLEPRAPQNSSVKPESTPSSNKSDKSELNSEMERYYNELRQKQSPQGQQYPFVSKQSQYAPKRPPTPPQQPSSSDEPIFDPVIRSNSQYRQQITPKPQQSAAEPSGTQQSKFAQSQNNLKASSYQSGVQPPAPEQYHTDSTGGDIGNKPMYFTSVNTDKSRKKGKETDIYRDETKKSFFRRLFKRGTS